MGGGRARGMRLGHVGGGWGSGRRLDTWEEAGTVGRGWARGRRLGHVGGGWVTWEELGARGRRLKHVEGDWNVLEEPEVGGRSMSKMRGNLSNWQFAGRTLGPEGK